MTINVKTALFSNIAFYVIGTMLVSSSRFDVRQLSPA